MFSSVSWGLKKCGILTAMKNTFFAILLAFFLTGQTSSQSISGLMSLDAAIDAAAQAIEGRVADGTEIAVYRITASRDEIGDFLSEELTDRFAMRGRLKPLAREAALNYVDTEHQFQMMGMVSDASAVGIGHYLGAKVVITGTFNQYADFSQLRLRAIDVRTSALLVSYTARLNNNDQILGNITAPFGPAVRGMGINEDALIHLNRGKDFFAEAKGEEAIREFDRVIAINRELPEAYFDRGLTSYRMFDPDRAIADFTQAIRLDANFVEAYYYRGMVYFDFVGLDQALADYDQAIRINPNFAAAYNGRGFVHFNRGDYDRAIVEFTQVIRLAPSDAIAYSTRGDMYNLKGDYDRAIADFTQAIRLDPHNTRWYSNLAYAYLSKGDYDLAITVFTQVIRLAPNEIWAYSSRGEAYYHKGDYDRAIADWEMVLRIDPNDAATRWNIEIARQQRGR